MSICDITTRFEKPFNLITQHRFDSLTFKIERNMTNQYINGIIDACKMYLFSIPIDVGETYISFFNKFYKEFDRKQIYTVKFVPFASSEEESMTMNQGIGSSSKMTVSKKSSKSKK